jgi:hypothetical protein
VQFLLDVVKPFNVDHIAAFPVFGEGLLPNMVDVEAVS